MAGAHDDHDERDGIDDERVASRADLLAVEREAGSDDPVAQAEAVIEESDERTETRRAAAPDAAVEHRSADEAAEAP